MGTAGVPFFVYLCVCVRARARVCVLRQQRIDSKFTVTHTYSDTLCNANTPYWHGHVRMNYLTTTVPTVTITTQQTT